MEVKPRSVIIYETSFQTCPFDRWFNGLGDEKTKNTILARINRVRLGLLGDCGPVGEGVSELIIGLGPGYRVYFGQEGLDLVVLLIGGDKSSQASDIKTAKKYWTDYKKRKQNASKTPKK